jgi:hypothetical protein
MPKAGEIANELRRIADALESANTEVELPRPVFAFYAESKETFSALADGLPRPLRKKINDADDERWANLQITSEMAAVLCYAQVPRNKMCTLVEPAKAAVYDCHPLLSAAELEEVGK